MSRATLPQDIVLLLCQELTFRIDFSTLFQCSLVSRRVASLALEQLYGMHELSPIHGAETFSLTKLARLWKSILLSSIGQTAYPYCTYVQSLSLGNYGSLLEDIWNNKAAYLLEPQDELKQFLVFRGNQKFKKTRNHVMPVFDFQQSMIEAGEAISAYVKQVADQTETSVALVHLEASMIPADILPIWLARLPSLQSLQLQDGSALTAEAASAIAKWCPKFSEFRCFLCQGSGVDENVASFLQNLRPNTLQCFEVISYNDIGEQTLTALNAHAESLQTLTLGSLPGDVMSSLNALPACTALESISLESQRHNPCDLAGNEKVLKEIVAWIGGCKNLRSLTLTNIRDSLLITKDVLNSPDVHLHTLDLQGFSSHGEEVDAAAWTALARQDSLEDLTIGGLDGMPDALIVHETPALNESICQLGGLRVLDLRRASVRAIELRRMIMALPRLTSLGFGGDWIDDQILESIGTLQHLKTLLVNALSIFTFDALKSFAERLDFERQRGIVVEINNQLGNYKFNAHQEAWFFEHFTTKLEGRMDIGVFKDPDEAHESDFSSDSE
ncbi:hypothetical protein SCAR479_01473 [Seiridium cardinale]|uniref:F-box domain-containing protein n=1 Tax=Seiridium cardinale TaxID=138064 RepID=A0ABR2Y5J4_9PEZI